MQYIVVFKPQIRHFVQILVGTDILVLVLLVVRFDFFTTFFEYFTLVFGNFGNHFVSPLVGGV